MEIAASEDSELKKIILEVVSDTEQAAQHAARALGFVEDRDYTEYVHFYSGKPHDLVVMELRMQPGLAEEPVEPGRYMF